MLGIEFGNLIEPYDACAEEWSNDRMFYAMVYHSTKRSASQYYSSSQLNRRSP